MNSTVDDETRSMLSNASKTALQKLGGMNLARAIQRGSREQSEALWQAFADQGWLGVLVPEELGGVGLGVREMAVISEELGRIAVASPFSACAVMSSVVLSESKGADIASHLSALMSAQRCYTLAWKETRFPDEAERLETALSGPGDELVVNGRKTLIVSDGQPDFYIVVAADQGTTSLCLVAAQAPGIERGDEYAVDGTCYQTISLSDAPVTQVLASGKEVARILDKALVYGTLSASAELYGVMSAALKLTLEYMRTRVQFGQAIGSFQALQHKAADMFVQKDLSFSVLSEALEAVSAGLSGAELVATVARAKARCSDAALRIVKDSVQLHGAIGYTDEYDLGCLVKRAMVLSAWLGNGTRQRREYFRATYLQ